MHRELKIAHAADLHLGSPFARLPKDVSERLIDEQRVYLGRIVDRCLEEAVDLLILAGDVFDRPDVKPIWVNRLADAMARLNPIDVYIVPGNHDPYYPGSAWERGDWSPNVRIFKTAQTVHNEGLGVDISAYPFTGLRQHVSLDDAHVELNEDPSNFRILVLHGELVSGQASKSAYNPISRKHPTFRNYDYVALGHVHQAETISESNERRTVIRYSGCPQGRGFDELGEKGFWIEQLKRGPDAGGRYITEHESRFIGMDTCQFLIEDIDLSNCEDEREVAVFVRTEVGRLMEQYGEAVLKKACLRLRLVGRIDTNIEIDLASLQDVVRLAGVSYIEMRDKTQPAWPLDRLRSENGFFGVLVRNYDRARETVLQSRKDQEEKEKQLRLLDEALNYALEAGEGKA